MRCKDARKKIVHWVDGELSPQIEREISLHVRTCEQCRKKAAQLNFLSELLDKIPSELPSSDLKSKTLEQFEKLVKVQTKTAFIKFDWVMRTAMAMGMAAGLFTGVGLGLNLASSGDAVQSGVSSVLYFSGGLLLSWV